MDTAPRSWFKHSSDSLSEPDIKRVKQKFGKLQGYAMYYISVELMIKHGGHIKECDLDLFCEDYGLEANELSEFFRFCLDSGVFTLSENGYTCELAAFTINKRNYIKTIASEAGKKSAEARQADSGPEPKKPKQPSLAPEIKEHWNANAKALRCKKLTSDIDKAVPDPKPELHPAPLPAPILPSPSQPEIAKPKKTNKSDSDNKKLMADVNEIVEAWNNTAKSCKCRKVTNEIIKAAKKRLETYSIEEIKTIILNYQTILQDDNTYFTYSWNLYEFLTRAKSFEYFNDDITVLSAKYRKFDADDNDESKEEDKWNWSFPQPKEWDRWSIEERKTYIKNNCIKETK